MLSIQLSRALGCFSGSDMLCTACDVERVESLMGKHVYRDKGIPKVKGCIHTPIKRCVHVYINSGEMQLCRAGSHHWLGGGLFGKGPQLQVEHGRVRLLGCWLIHHRQTLRL